MLQAHITFALAYLPCYEHSVRLGSLIYMATVLVKETIIVGTLTVSQGQRCYLNDVLAAPRKRKGRPGLIGTRSE
jgi:hypothetical protein